MTSFHRAASLVALGLLCAACSKPPPPAPHPVDVATVTVHPQATSFPEDFVAETEAINAVEIRPRVGGELVKRVPNEGERVKAGELLFVIDREPYIAALAQAKAGLGNINPILYPLAENYGGVFHDITAGNNIVPCRTGSSGFEAGFAATPGRAGTTVGGGAGGAPGVTITTGLFLGVSSGGATGPGGSVFGASPGTAGGSTPFG